MRQKHGKEERLKDSLKKILGQADLKYYRELITRFSTELDVSFLDCASALLFLKQPNISPSFYSKNHSTNEINSELASTFS